MNLQEFIDQMNEDIKEFDEYWRECNKTDDQWYPMEMKGDQAVDLWLDSFISFLDIKHLGRH